MMRIDDEILIAFADGELGPDEAARVASALAADARLRDRLARQQRLKLLVAGHYAPVVEEDVPERLSALLLPRRSEVVDLAAARVRRARPAWQSFAALAATLLLGLFAGRTLMPGGAGPVAIENGMMMARGDLADTLETRLASEQASDAETRIGVSFAAADGRLCRTFDGPSLSGLACRESDGWQLITTAAPASPAPDAQFRQAGSGSEIVLSAAQGMMVGDPFDATTERRARQSGWRNSAGRD